MRAGGFPGNPGGLIVSILKVAGGRAPAHQARGPWTWHLASDGANPQVLGWYRRAKATKRGGWAARNRSVS